SGALGICARHPLLEGCGGASLPSALFERPDLSVTELNGYVGHRLLHEREHYKALLTSRPVQRDRLALQALFSSEMRASFSRRAFGMKRRYARSIIARAAPV